jgi:hypothetical protein
MNLKSPRNFLVAGLLLIFLGLLVVGWQFWSGDRAKVVAQERLTQLASERGAMLEKHLQTQALALQKWVQLNIGLQRIKILQAAAEKSAVLLKAKVDTNTVSQALRQYYIADFGSRFRQATGSQAGAVQTQVDRLSDLGLSLQYLQFVKALPEPNDYTAQVAALDATVNEQKNLLGWNDLLLVNASNATVLYSYAKGIELGTNLTEGPMSRTALGDLLQNSLASRAITLSDIDRHIPALGQEVFFIAFPVMQDQHVMFIAILQLPSKPIQDILSANQQWSQLGLASTGELQLLGPDHAPRNKSRQMSIDPAFAVEQLRSNVTEATLAAIKVVGSDSLLRRIETEGSKAALSQSVWSGQYSNFLRKRVVGASVKVDAYNQRYSVLAEQEESEVVPQGIFSSKWWPISLVAFGLASLLANWILKRRQSAVLAPPIEQSAMPDLEDQTVLVPIAPASQVTTIPISIKQPAAPGHRTGNGKAVSAELGLLIAGSATAGKLIESSGKEIKLQQAQWSELSRTFEILEALVERSASLALNATLTINAPVIEGETSQRQLALIADELRRLALSAHECVGQAACISSQQVLDSTALVALNQQLHNHWQAQHDLLARTESIDPVAAL